MAQLIADMIGLTFVILLVSLGIMCLFIVYELLKHYTIEVTECADTHKKRRDK